MCFFVFFFFFFFQAEDGIRDHCVTGVQTCALPIYVELAEVVIRVVTRRVERECLFKLQLSGSEPMQFQERSEERRVGKECRSRWSRYNKKKKKRGTEQKN